MLHVISAVAYLPVLVATGADALHRIVAVRLGASWSEVLDRASGICTPEELRILRTAEQASTCGVVVHHELPEDVRGRLHLFCAG